MLATECSAGTARIIEQRANFTNQTIPCAGRLRLGKNAKAESVKGD